MTSYLVTKHVVLTLDVEADSEDEAEALAAECEALDEWDFVDMTSQWVEKIGG
ncbi:MAG: hypothetical protein DDT39_00035 [Firmicutes bacterium]|nr:hypothetical protein [candidate division NPL-UPA2 bacterium]